MNEEISKISDAYNKINVHLSTYKRINIVLSTYDKVSQSLQLYTKAVMSVRELRNKVDEIKKLIAENKPYINKLYDLKLKTNKLFSEIFNAKTIKELMTVDVENEPEKLTAILIEHIETKLEKLTQLKNKKGQQNQAELNIYGLPLAPKNSFKDLFKKPELIEGAVRILKETDPPTINDKNEYIGHHKGVLVVWLNALAQKGLIKHISTHQDMADILNANFIDLNISESLFRQKNKRAVSNYESQFSSEILILKH